MTASERCGGWRVFQGLRYPHTGPSRYRRRTAIGSLDRTGRFNFWCFLWFGCPQTQGSKREVTREQMNKLVPRTDYQTEDPDDLWSLVSHSQRSVKITHPSLHSMPWRFSALLSPSGPSFLAASLHGQARPPFCRCLRQCPGPCQPFIKGRKSH